jgi:predicted nucleotidyltransferase
VAVAEALRPVLDRVVLVGGQVAELLITDPAAVRVRPTTEVDVIVATGSRSEFRQLERELASLGFRNDISEGAPICRWIGAEGHRLNLMPADDAILGFSNRWYPMATEAAVLFQLGPELSIRIPRAPVFVASKLAAFRSRGRDDLLASHDLEDVVAVVAGRAAPLSPAGSPVPTPAPGAAASATARRRNR